MQSSPAFRTAAVGDKVLNAYRQVWLAGLGAAAVTRGWAGKEAGTAFRTLVREGTAVESRARRYVDTRLGPTVVQANSLLREARRTMTRYADTAVTLVREMPVTLPRIELAAFMRREKPAARRAAKARRPGAKAAKSVKSARTVKTVRRGTKATARRAKTR